MSLDWEQLGSEGIGFLARLGVSSAKDLARVLADLDRQAGQAEEMAEAAEQGVPADPGQLARLASKLARNLDQASGLVERFRQAALAAEHPVGLVNVSELAERMAGFLRPRAERKNVGLVVKGTENPAFAASNAFFLQNLLYLALEQALDGTEQGPVEVMVRSEENGASVEIVPPGLTTTEPGLREKLALLAHSLEGEMTLDQRSLRLILPSRGRLIRSLRGGPDR